jgi:arsenite-transporting ATPase
MTDPNGSASGELCPVMLFSGKGGVGKTTLAAATAVRLARMGSTVLTMSTDPAHSLSDALAVPLGPQPRQVMPGLDAMEIDARGMFNEAIDQTMGEGKVSSLSDLMRLVSQTPGVDEFGAIEMLMEIMERAQHDVVILDTAPTGHTLRLLMLPDLLDSWLGKLLEMKARIAKIGRLLRRLFPGGASPDEELLDKGLTGGRQRIGGLRDVLTDPDRSQIVLVTIPEAMSVAETERTLQMLQGHGMPVATVVVNQMQPRSGSCIHCRRRREIHESELVRMRRIAGDVPVRVVDSLSWEVRGLQGLLKMGDLLWGERGDQSA